jgi:FkbH-like protein
MAGDHSMHVRTGAAGLRRIGALGVRFVRDKRFRNVTIDLIQRQSRDRDERFQIDPDAIGFDVSWVAGKRIFFIGGCEFTTPGITLRGLGAEVFHTFEEGAATDPLLELSRPDSAFWTFDADVLVLSQAHVTGGVVSKLQSDPLGIDRETQARELADLANHFRQAIIKARTVHQGPIVLMTHPLLYRPALGINEHLSFPDRYSLAEVLRLQALQMYELAREHEHVHVLDTDVDAESLGKERWFETERTSGSYEHFTKAGSAALVRGLLLRLSALEPSLRRIKCVAVDLDNTMWNGVLREDGPDGVRPRGCYVSMLQMLAARGMVLAVVSKNDPEEAQYLPALLGEELAGQFAVLKLGWGAKSQALVELAKELNIGLDAVAFFDDNPRERAEVELNAPEVLVLSDADITPSLARAEFQPLGAVTPDGARRGEHYRTAAARATAAAAVADAEAGDIDDFLHQSELHLTVRPPKPGELARAAEMAARTNQLNATMARTDLPTMQQWAADGHVIRVAELRDRFGDYGLIGVAVGGAEGTDHRLLELAISCRAMGRSVEAALVAAVAGAAAEEGAARIVLPFVRSSRNAELERILRGIGFEDAGDAGDVGEAGDASGEVVQLALPVDTKIEPPAWLDLDLS